MAVAPPVARFIASYPEFARIPASSGTALIQTKLQEAATRTNRDVYESDATCELAVMLRAAILLSLSPDARKMRLVDDTTAFIWKTQLKEMQVAATQGYRVF